MPQLSDLGYTLNRTDVSTLFDYQDTGVDLDTLDLDTQEDINPESITDFMINELSVAKLVTGTIASQQITLDITDTIGDVYLGMGSFDADAWTCTRGILMGMDDSDSNGVKMYVGNAASWWDWNVTTPNTLTISGTIAVGSYPGLPPDSLLAGYWAFDEGSGAAALDSTSNANNGVITGATYTNGVSGKCLTFDGASGDVQVSDNAAFQNIWAGGGAISFWINPNSDGEGSSGNIINKMTGWVVAIDSESGGSAKLSFYKSFSGNTPQWQTTSTDLTIDEWNHIVITYDADSTANDPIIYVNGESVALTESGVPSGTSTTDVGSDLYFGNRAADDRTFDGEIDEVRLYTSTITALAASALFLNPGGNTVTTIGPDQITTDNLSAISAVLGSVTVGADGFARQGQTDYDTGTGWWIGDDSGTPKMSIGISGKTGFTFDGTTTTFLGAVLNVGDGADSALNVTSGTTTIDLSNEDVVVKNYSSINVSNGATLAFSNPATNGTFIILKSQGDVTFAGTVDASGMGAAGGTGGTSPLGDGTDGTKGNTMFAQFSEGVGGDAAEAVGPSPNAVVNIFSLTGGMVKVSAGSGGGAGGGGSTDANDGDGGNGGRGGGGFGLLCSGAFNFAATGVINVSGADGSNGQDNQVANRAGGGAGGGGASGSIFIAYHSLTADSGTYTMAGGNGGDGGDGDTIGGPGGGAAGTGGNNRQIGGAGGGGGAAGGAGTAGSNGAAGNGTAGTGGSAGGGVGNGGGGGGGGAGGDKIVLALNQMF